MELLLGTYFLLCLAVAFCAVNKGRSGFGFFILSLVTSPLFGGFCVLLMKEDKSVWQKTKKCPFCAEEIKKEAVFCKYCRQELPVEPAPYISPYRNQFKTSIKDPHKKSKPLSAIDITIIVLSIAVFIVLALCANAYLQWG